MRSSQDPVRGPRGIRMPQFDCNQVGHKFTKCPGKLSQGTKTSHGTQQNPPKQCPACGDQHTGTDSNGKTFYKESLEERANIVQQTDGCVLCLDWTGDHKAKD